MVKHVHESVIRVVAALAMALPFSCSREDTEEWRPAPDLNAPIESLSATPDAATRGLDELNWDRIKTQRFGIVSLWHEAERPFSTLTGLQTFYINNSDVAYLRNDGGLDYWRCSPTQYWPIEGWLTFFAYAPFQTKIKRLSGETADPPLLLPSDDYTGGYLRGKYTPNTDVTRQVDLCLSSPVCDRARGSGAVPFSFNHALTRLRFYLNLKGADASGYAYRLYTMTVKGVVPSNCFTFADEDPGFVWDEIPSSTARTGSYTLSLANSELMSEALKIAPDNDPSTPWTAPENPEEHYTYANKLVNGRLYLVPQNLTSDAHLELVLSVHNQSGSGVGTTLGYLPPLSVRIPATVAWLPGKTVAYFLTVDLSDFRRTTVDAVLANWMDAENVQEPFTVE